MLNRDQLKREAKQLAGKGRVSAYLITLIFIGITGTLDMIQMFISGDFAVIWETYMAVYQETFSITIPTPPVLYGLAETAKPVLIFVSVMTWLISTVLRSGLMLYHLGVRRGEQMPYATLFDGFSFAGKIVLLELVVLLSVILGSFLLFFPGVIVAYRYRFALYNLCENPEMGVMEAINMSAVQTQGYKMELFKLDLSFFGWSVLCTLTGGILSIWFSPYMLQTDIGYFQQIKANKGVGWIPKKDDLNDGQFRSQDPFDTQQ